MAIFHRAYAGETFHQCWTDAIRKATIYQQTVVMIFNQIPVQITASTTIEHSWQAYIQARQTLSDTCNPTSNLADPPLV